MLENSEKLQAHLVCVNEHSQKISAQFASTPSLDGKILFRLYKKLYVPSFLV